MTARHRHIRQLALPSVAIAAAAVVEAASAAGNCYPRTAQPPMAGAWVTVLEDPTTPKAAAWQDLSHQVLRSLQPGRYRVLRFDGPQPTLLLDEQIQPLPTPERISVMPIKEARRVQACLHAQTQLVRSALTELLGSMGNQPTSTARYSEVVGALHETLRLSARVGQHGQLFVYSDGLEHSADGLSFYSRRAPRAVTPTVELARIPQALRQSPVEAALRGGVTVTWYGLGAHEKKDAPYGAAAIASWREFWTGLFVQQWGLQQVQVGATVLEPMALR